VPGLNKAENSLTNPAERGIIAVGDGNSMDVLSREEKIQQSEQGIRRNIMSEKTKMAEDYESHKEKIEMLYPDGVEYGKSVIVEPPTLEELGDIIEESEPVTATAKPRTLGQPEKPAAVVI